MQLSPAVVIHLTAALAALVIGPVALWARQGRQQRPRLHRAFGYAWVTAMLTAAASAIFIPSALPGSIAGFSWIHLFVPLTVFGLFAAFYALAKGKISAHRKAMQALYYGGCVVPGLFTLLPGRFLGNLVWIEWLGLSQRHLFIARQIVVNTPLWVWALLAGLVALGITQTRARQAGLRRIVAMPLVMTGFSLWGTYSTFSASPMFTNVMLVWAALAAAVFAAVAPGRTGAEYDAATRTFKLPGSWMPMVLILGVFLCKYAAGVSLAMNPALAHDAAFALGIAALNGVMSGLFIGRAGRLLRLAHAVRAPHAVALQA